MLTKWAKKKITIILQITIKYWMVLVVSNYYYCIYLWGKIGNLNCTK